MLDSHQAEQLSIYFVWKKISSVAPPWGTWLRTHYWGKEREEEKACTQQELIPQHWEFCSSGMCSTAVLQQLPKLSKLGQWKSLGSFYKKAQSFFLVEKLGLPWKDHQLDFPLITFSQKSSSFCNQLDQIAPGNVTLATDCIFYLVSRERIFLSRRKKGWRNRKVENLFLRKKPEIF